jgi:hypothetical protein
VDRGRRQCRGKEGLEGEGEYGGEKKKAEGGRMLSGTLIETKCVGKENGAWQVGADTGSG